MNSLLEDSMTGFKPVDIKASYINEFDEQRNSLLKRSTIGANNQSIFHDPEQLNFADEPTIR